MTETKDPKEIQEEMIQSVVDQNLIVKVVEPNCVEISGPKNGQLEIWQKLNDTKQFEIVSSQIVKKKAFVLKIRLLRKYHKNVQDLPEHVRSIIS